MQFRFYSLSYKNSYIYKLTFNSKYNTHLKKLASQKAINYPPKEDEIPYIIK